MARFRNNSTGVVISVADHKDERFVSGWSIYDGTDPRPKSENPDKSWKVDELKAYADDKSIDLGPATKKEDILVAIAAASGDDTGSQN